MAKTSKSLITDDAAIRLGLEFYLENRESIDKLCRRLVRRSPIVRQQQTLELAHDEAIRVIPMAMLTYCSDRGTTLKTHILGNIRWYVWKAIVADLRDSVREYDDKLLLNRDYFNDEQHKRYYKDSLVQQQEREPAELNGHMKLFDSAQVQYLLDRLPVEYAALLRWRFLDEMSVDEIALELDCSRVTAWRYINDAIQAARSLIHVNGCR
jgi:hypothetical protein